MKLALSILLLLCLVIAICLVLFAVTRPDRARTTWLTVTCMALMIYTLGYFAEISAETIEGVWSALIVENFAIPVIPWFFLLTSISLFSPVKFRRWQGIVSIVYLLIMFLIIITNPYHEMYYSYMQMVDGFVRLGHGPLYFVNQILVFACMITSYSIMAVRFVKGSRKLRRQMIAFIAGSLIAFSANLLNALSIVPPGIDPTPICLTIGLILFSVSLLRDDVVDVVVRARDIALENMNDGLIVLDRDGDFLYCNRCAMDIFPKLQSFQGTESISSLDNWPEELNNLKEEHVEFSLDIELGGRYYRASVQKIYSWNALHIGVSVLLRDISEETYLIGQLKELATTDPLTGILNRRHFMEAAEAELKNARNSGLSSAVILFDIDHFKSINDLYGHPAGDTVLRRTVEAVRGALRQGDLFGRYGGEEFVILTTGQSLEDTVKIAERLRQVIEKASAEDISGKSIRVTASFGAAEIKPDGNLRNALSRADTAMYKAKNSGRNRVVIDNY